MSISISRDTLCDVVSGRAGEFQGSLSSTGLEFDSRNIRGGELFVALAGEQSHGHDFVMSAFERGASLFLVEDSSLFADFPEPERLIEVEDTLEAFWTLAGWWRQQTAIPIAAVTGSVGKTSVKELAARFLLQRSRGMYSQKSFNNHTGVPYTLCQISRDHAWAVVEIGMNAPGEIAPLSKLTAPQAALVTKIAPVHIENFPSVKAIGDEKLSIAEGLSDQGKLLLNKDDAILVEKSKDFGSRYELAWFGEESKADVQVGAIEEHGLSGISFTLFFAGQKVHVKTPVLGKHNAFNAAAALLLARTLDPDLSPDDVERALEHYRPPEMRLVQHKLQNGTVVLDDCYNANPASMAAALSFTASIAEKGATVGLILGDMLELGEEAERFHKEIASQALALQPEFLIAVGEFAPLFYAAARDAGRKAFVAESPEMAANIAEKMAVDIILVKGSRGVALDCTVSRLIDSVGAAPFGEWQPKKEKEEEK